MLTVPKWPVAGLFGDDSLIMHIFQQIFQHVLLSDIQKTPLLSIVVHTESSRDLA